MKFGDLFRGEFLNLGVFAYNTNPQIDKVSSRFLSNLSRIEITFGRSDIFLESMLESSLKNITTKTALQETMKSCDSPHSSLQFTLPRASLDEDPEKLAEEMAKTFLVE